LLQDETGKIAVEQRPSKGLLANMWQFPMLEMGRLPENIAEEKIHLHKQTEIEIKEKRGEVKHVFSHVIWELEIYTANVIHKTMHNDNFFFYFVEMIELHFTVAL